MAKPGPRACAGLLVLLGCGQGSSAATPDASAGPDGAGHDTGVADASARDTAPGLETGTTPDGSAPDSTLADGPSVSESGVACGTRTGMRGLTSRMVSVGGVARTYLIYLPQNLDPATPVPFVYVFHGATMNGQEMHDITQYSVLADSEGIGIAFPDGENGTDSLFPWNVENSGQTVCGAGQFAEATGDDFGFMDAMKADVSLDQCLDQPHLFATGFSMGGYFSHHIGCYRSDIRAVAPHSGGTIADLSVCTTGHVPIIIFHGTSDPVIAEGCDDPTGLAQLGFPASATLWAAKNGCQTTYTTVPTDGDAGGDGQCYVYDGCPSDGQVELCTFTGMGHCWAGGDQTGGNTLSACPTYASATALEWSFFKKYAW
jgi:polyhydroxybutyrate depolymerase